MFSTHATNFNDRNTRFFVEFINFDVLKKRCRSRKHMTKIVQFVKNEKKINNHQISKQINEIQNHFSQIILSNRIQIR